MIVQAFQNKLYKVKRNYGCLFVCMCDCVCVCILIINFFYNKTINSGIIIFLNVSNYYFISSEFFLVGEIWVERNCKRNTDLSTSISVILKFIDKNSWLYSPPLSRTFFFCNYIFLFSSLFQFRVRIIHTINLTDIQLTDLVENSIQIYTSIKGQFTKFHTSSLLRLRDRVHIHIHTDAQSSFTLSDLVQKVILISDFCIKSHMLNFLSLFFDLSCSHTHAHKETSDWRIWMKSWYRCKILVKGSGTKFISLGLQSSRSYTRTHTDRQISIHTDMIPIMLLSDSGRSKTSDSLKLCNLFIWLKRNDKTERNLQYLT